MIRRTPLLSAILLGTALAACTPPDTRPTLTPKEIGRAHV